MWNSVAIFYYTFGFVLIVDGFLLLAIETAFDLRRERRIHEIVSELHSLGVP